MIIGNVGIGEVFRYNGALFIVCEYDWADCCYPSLCIVTRNHKYDRGEHYNLDEKIEVDEIISEARLLDFIPKGIDYEME